MQIDNLTETTFNISWEKPVVKGYVHPFDVEIFEMTSTERTAWKVTYAPVKYMLKQEICDRILSLEEAKQQVQDWVNSGECTSACESLKTHS
jgi:hypothetical protein